MLLKEILAQKSWPIDAVVGANCRGRGSDSLGRRCGFNPAMNSASILLQKKPRSRLIMVTIKRRSGHDRVTIGP